MATVITADNVPAVLAQIVERQDELDAQLEALTGLFADEAVRVDGIEEQSRVQARALRTTATLLSRDISDVAKATNGNRNGNGNPRSSNGKGNPGISGAGVGGEVSLGPLEVSADVGGRVGTQQGRSRNARQTEAAEPASEPEPPERKKVHRWI